MLLKISNSYILIIRIIYKIIPAIGVQVYAADGFGSEVVEAVGGNELSAPGVIVSGYEIVKLSLFVVVITAVTLLWSIKCNIGLC